MEELNHPEHVHADNFQESTSVRSTSMITQRRTSRLAIASLILGFLSMFGGGFFLLPPLSAVILGHIAVNLCSKDPNLVGKSMGVAGLFMGWLWLAVWILIVLLLGSFAALGAAIGAA